MNSEYAESADDFLEYDESANDSVITAYFRELGIRWKRWQFSEYDDFVNSEYMESATDYTSTFPEQTFSHRTSGVCLFQFLRRFNTINTLKHIETKVFDPFLLLTLFSHVPKRSWRVQ